MARKASRKSAVKAKKPRARRRKATAQGEPPEDYRHDQKRKNNPEAGLVSYEAVQESPPPKQYEYDPHLDPQLTWAGKTEHTSFEVDTVSLHIHERVSTQAIIGAVQRQPKQFSLFADPQLPLKKAVEFYQHDVDWANRLVLGDSLVVMNSLLERELMAGKVQMIYLDPPYGVAYNSNFQPRTDRRDVKDGDDGSLTREPEMVKAYRDTWQLGIHSYLTYLRDRLLLCRELLHESGSIFVQISDENMHLVRNLLDEVFGADNFAAVIAFRKTSYSTSELVPAVFDHLLWYAKDKSAAKYRQLYVDAPLADFEYAELSNGSMRRLTREERARDGGLTERAFRSYDLASPGIRTGTSVPYIFKGQEFRPSSGRHWKTTPNGLDRLAAAGRLAVFGSTLRQKRYYDDFPFSPLTNLWGDTIGETQKLYVVQTSAKVIERCILMITDPGDLVLDPTCGAGTTAYAAEHWGRRWITVDTSRVALALARQRLLTGSFPYYRLAHPEQGVKGGFAYELAPHATLDSVAQNPELDPDKVEARCQRIRKENPKAKPEEIERLLRQENEEIIRSSADQETLYDRPEIERGKVRVPGPFTVEAIPVAVAEGPSESPIPEIEADARGDDITRRGSGAGPVSDPAGDHVATMLDLLQASGVTFPGGKRMKLANLRPIASGGALHAEAEIGQNGKAQRVAISFGPRHGPVSARQVNDAMPLARRAGYDILVFAGFGFDPRAQEDMNVPVPGLAVHAANVCPDVLVGDLLKTTAGSQLFTVFGQPDVQVRRVCEGPKGRKASGKAADEKVEYVAELQGVDIYDPTTGEVHSAKGGEVAAWFLDTDYDGRTFCICQAFFPGGDNPWQKLQRALRGSIDPERFDEMRGTISQPFEAGEHQRIAVKVIDFRGNEVVRVCSLDSGELTGGGIDHDGRVSEAGYGTATGYGSVAGGRRHLCRDPGASGPSCSYSLRAYPKINL